MVSRNQKGQILIEAVFLCLLFSSMILAMKKMISVQQEHMNKIKLSKTVKRNYENQNTKNQSAE